VIGTGSRQRVFDESCTQALQGRSDFVEQWVEFRLPRFLLGFGE
jgi:hypothetical protein